VSQLYTSLVMAKQALNGGHLPPMTPVPERLHHIINPEYVPGLGALRIATAWMRSLACAECGGTVVEGCEGIMHRDECDVPYGVVT